MAYGSGDINLMELWNQSDADSQRKIQLLLRTGLDKRRQASSPLAARIKVTGDVDNPTIRWMEQEGYPSRILGTLSTTTLTFSGNLFGAAITADSVAQVIRVGAILERPTDGVQVKVTSVSGLASTPWDCTVEAYGNSTLSDDSTAVNWDILAEVWYDARDADTPRAVDRTFRECGTQIHAETFQILKTRENTSYVVVQDEVQNQIDELVTKLRHKVDYSLIRMRPYYKSGAYVTGISVADPTMTGLCSWPLITQAELSNTNVYVNKAGEPLTKDDLDNFLEAMWLEEHADFNSGDWVLACHPYTANYIHDFDISYRRTDADRKTAGFSIDSFASKVGREFPIVADRFMRENTLIAVNLAKAEYGYYKGDKLDRQLLPSEGRYRRWLISFQTYGVVMRNPRSNIAMIYNLPR